MSGLTISRQCSRCQSGLPTGWRPPLCPACRPVHQRARNLAKVRAFRERARSSRAVRDPEGRPPTEEELDWLDSLGLDELWELVERACELQSEGRLVPDPELMDLARRIVTAYDASRVEFDHRATLIPGPAGIADLWRGFFESARRLVS